MKTNVAAKFLPGLLLSLTACVMTPKLPMMHDFGPAALKSNTSNPSQPAIAVDAPTWLWDNRIRYRLLYASPTRVGFYALDQWLAAPPELLQQQFSAGEAMPYPLLIQLLDFEQQFDSADQSRVVIRLSAEALSVDRKRKLGVQEFRLEQPTKTPNAAGAIDGFSRLVRQAERQIRAWAVGLANQERPL